MRADGANVVLAPDGRLLAWLGRRERSVLTFFAEDARQAEQDAQVTAEALSRSIAQRERLAYLIAVVDGADVSKSRLGKALLATGFQSTSRGYLKRAQKHREEAELVDVDLEDEL